MMVSAQPNEAAIVAHVVSLRAADNGWGSLVTLTIESVSDIPGLQVANWARHLSGQTVQVFAPPPMAAVIYQAGGRFEGTLTVGEGAVARYALARSFSYTGA